MKFFFPISAGLVVLLVAVSGCGGGGGSPNQAPTANAGVDQSVDAGTIVNLSGTGADNDGSITTISRQQESGAAVTIANANMANASFVAPTVAVSEVLVFRVTVTDNDGATGSDTVAVTVNNPSLLAHIDFDSDVPGVPPATGGVNEPTSLSISSGTSVLVQAASNGISTQPVVLADGGAGNYVTLSYAFSPPVSSDVLRVEATVSFNRLFGGYFLQTTESSSAFSAVVNRLIARSSGELQAEVLSGSSDPRPVLGTYLPNEPFRVRMDIDIEGGSWSFILDDELNGFADDPLISDLPFVNDIMSLPRVGAVHGGLNVFQTGAPTTVAYDDISVLVVPSAEININIKPGNDPNAINLSSRDVILVAVLGSVNFDATQVDSSTAEFGPGKASPVHDGHVEDVNNDYIFDMVFHFNTQDTGFACGDTRATLSGETFGGDAFTGTDSVKTGECM